MLDIHCHILPGVDDGSEDMEESLEMARMAVGSGVTAIAATSHFRGELNDCRRLPLLNRRFEMLENTLAQLQIPLRLYHGAEILCLPETPLLARRQLLPTLGLGNYVLMEFYFDETPEMMDYYLSAAEEQGYRVVVAHPERYDAVQRDLGVLCRWFDRGYAIQVNKGSIFGRFGSGAEYTVQEILRRGLAHAVASDAHGADFRTTRMYELTDWCREHLRQHYSHILLEENPRRILSGESLVPVW